MKYLITGGLGYIGSHVMKHLYLRDHEIHVVDNLSTGSPNILKSFKNILFIKCDIRDMEKYLQYDTYDYVLHFAAKTSVEESGKKSKIYLKYNVEGTEEVIRFAKKHSKKGLIFSSTAAVQNPESSIYAMSKYTCEKMIEMSGIPYKILRYYNAAGCDIDGILGENHDPETHLIPKMIDCFLNLQPFHIYGNDWETPDGTCIRDYVHVEDVAFAHIAAMDYPNNVILNIGTGKGYSVLEIVNTFKKMVNKPLSVTYAEKRNGDVASLIAPTVSIDFGWKPKYSDLNTILDTTLKWRAKNKI